MIECVLTLIILVTMILTSEIRVELLKHSKTENAIYTDSVDNTGDRNAQCVRRALNTHRHMEASS